MTVMIIQPVFSMSIRVKSPKNKIIQEHDYKKSCSEIFFRSSYDFIDRRIFSIYFLMQNPVSYMDEYPVK